MEFKIVQPRSECLKRSIEYFLFIHSKESSATDGYTTIPNTNVCLSIYKKNTIEWNRKVNTCHLKNSTSFGQSKIYGWHSHPFKVSLSGQLDQICIIFKPAGLADFTHLNLNDIDIDDNPLEELFGKTSIRLKYKLFELTCVKKRSELLENYLLDRINPKKKNIVHHYMRELNENSTSEQLSIGAFCKQYKINESTLYRNFLATVGESVKQYQRKHRFRNFLDNINDIESFTHLSYSLNYADQSHFIKEVRKFTGFSPRKFISRLKIVEDKLLLIQ